MERTKISLPGRRPSEQRSAGRDCGGGHPKKFEIKNFEKNTLPSFEKSGDLTLKIPN
jgi:hypothetical protein